LGDRLYPDEILEFPICKIDLRGFERISHENRHDAKRPQAYKMKLPVGIFILTAYDRPAVGHKQ
jgi:hypothetical protein